MKTLLTRVRDALRLMIGVGSYEHYLAHRRAHHAHEPVMTRAEFVAASQRARYGEGSSRCC